MSGEGVEDCLEDRSCPLVLCAFYLILSYLILSYYCHATYDGAAGNTGNTGNRDALAGLAVAEPFAAAPRRGDGASAPR